MYLCGNGFYWRVALQTMCRCHLSQAHRGGIRPGRRAGRVLSRISTAPYGGLWLGSITPPNLCAASAFTRAWSRDAYRHTAGGARQPSPWGLRGVKDDCRRLRFLRGGADASSSTGSTIGLGSPLQPVVLASSEGHAARNSSPSTRTALASPPRSRRDGWISSSAPHDLLEEAPGRACLGRFDHLFGTLPPTTTTTMSRGSLSTLVTASASSTSSGRSTHPRLPAGFPLPRVVDGFGMDNL